MKHLYSRSAFCLLALGLSAAIHAEDQGMPATSNVPGAQAPRIHKDLRITFTLKAPDAASLQVAGGDGLGMGPFPMTKSADGTWSVTTPPSVPGFHYYWFVLNGVEVNDPASETYFGYGKETSGIEVPEPGADFYAIKNVPHGEVRAKWYFSKTTGEWRRAFVYTPPDTMSIRPPATLCSFCSMVRERTKPAGHGRAGHSSFSTISSPPGGRVR